MAQSQSTISQLLSGLNGMMSDPNSAGLTGLAQGLLAASAPHMLTPVTMGQALGMGAASSQQYQNAALQNAMLRQTVPFQGMKVASFANALKTLQDPKASPADKATARALVANLVSPGMGPSMIANSPAIQGPKEAAISQNKPTSVGASDRVFGPVGAPSVGAQGAIPQGARQPLGQLNLSMLPGALPAIAASSGAGAGGAAAATYPFQSALKRTGLMQGPVSNRVLSVAPPAPQPAFPGGQAQPPSPAVVQAAIAAARQRQMGMAQGMQGNGAPMPGAAPQQPLPPQVQQAIRQRALAIQQARQAQQSPGMPQAPMAPQGGAPVPPMPQQPGTAPVAPAQPGAPPGAGVIAPGMTPSAITGQQVVQKLATTQLASDVQSGQEAQQRVASLEELNAVAGKLQTGPGTEARLAVERALASVPGVIGQQAGKLSTITDAQIFNKTALNLSLQTVSSAGQTAYNSLNTVVHAFPELAKTNMANAVVTGSLLATARYQADKGKFAATWQQQNQGMGFVPGKGTADAMWTKQAPFMAYFMNSLPPEAQRALIQKAQTNRTLRAELLQAAQGQRWLGANGF